MRDQRVKAMSDLYDYDTNHIGRKSYVSVRGHNKSVPAYKTYRGVDGYNYVSPEYGGTNEGRTSNSTYLMPDKLQYISPMDGTLVTSRSQHREQLRKHNVEEAGDIPFGYFSSQKQDPHPPVTSRDIADAIKQLGGH
jgi:hypothetical protein